VRDGVEVDRLRTRKTDGLLAWLALNRGTAYSRPALVERFWPEEEEATARRKLRLALHSIRQEIGDALETERDNVLLREAWVDALDSEEPSGELLPDFDFDWLSEARADLALRQESRLQKRLDEQLGGDDAEGAKETLYALLESDPYEPRWYRLLHRNLLALGRKGEARVLAGIARSRLGAECPPGLLEGAPANVGPRRSFVGRSRILASLSERLLGDEEPVAAMLLGPGGIGKTRIGQELMAYAKREGIEAYFVRLLDQVTEAEVRNAVLTALPPDPDAFDVSVLPPTLLVLDNCEQCSPEAIRWLEGLLVAGSSLRILATSQRPLEGFSAEAVAVPALSLVSNPSLEAAIRSEACQLFAMEAEIDIDARTAPSIATICRRMGGVPLAIRHAAARLAETTLKELTDSIETFDRTRDRARRDADPRHRSVANCVHWSLSLLDERLRGQLAKLAFFADAFRPESAEALGVPAEDLERLIRLNWISRRHGEDVLELLPPFRAVLRTHLSDLESSELQRKLIRYLADRIAADVRPRYTTLVVLLDIHARDMQESFAAQLETGALDLAESMFVGLYHVKHRSGDLAGARRDAEAFVAAIPKGTEAKYPNAFNLFGSVAYFQRDLALAETCYSVAAAGEDAYLRSVGQANLALVAMRRREFAKAIPLLEAVIEFPGIPARSRGARWLNLAECLMAVGRTEEAEAIGIRELAALSEDPEVRTVRGLIILTLGEIAAARGQKREARDWVERALALFELENQRIRVAEARVLLVWLVPRDQLREELKLLMESDESVDYMIMGFGLALHENGEAEWAAPFLAAIDWAEAPVWVNLIFGHLEAEISVREGLRHSSREEWRLRAESVMKRL
jgi:tetratricopeptide (TPR) repeat protein